MRVYGPACGCGGARRPRRASQDVRPASIAGVALGQGGVALGALAHHRIGAHQALPAGGIVGMGFQPVGEAIDHLADGVVDLGLGRGGGLVHRLLAGGLDGGDVGLQARAARIARRAGRPAARASRRGPRRRRPSAPGRGPGSSGPWPRWGSRATARRKSLSAAGIDRAAGLQHRDLAQHRPGVGAGRGGEGGAVEGARGGVGVAGLDVEHGQTHQRLGVHAAARRRSPPARCASFGRAVAFGVGAPFGQARLERQVRELRATDHEVEAERGHGRQGGQQHDHLVRQSFGRDCAGDFGGGQQAPGRSRPGLRARSSSPIRPRAARSSISVS